MNSLKCSWDGMLLTSETAVSNRKELEDKLK